jgi:hypothetical protein
MASLGRDLQLAVAQLVIFTILFLLTIYISWKHGKMGMVAWPLLNSMCILQMVAAILHIMNQEKPLQEYTGSAGFAITTSGSIATLILAAVGVIHQA